MFNFFRKYILLYRIYFQIVGPAELCQKISDSLHQNALKRRWQISIHQCESIADVIKARIDISVDFIIFAFDSRTAHTLSEVSSILLHFNFIY